MSWSWKDVYPNHRVLTLVLDEDQAELLLASAGARAVAPNVLKLDEGAELILRGARPPKPKSPKPKPREVHAPPAKKESRPKTLKTPKALKPPSKPVRKAVESTPKGREPKPPKQQPPKEQPPRPPAAPQPPQAPAAPQPLERPKRRTPRAAADTAPSSAARSNTADDIALVEEALASGKVTVTKCPPRQGTPEDEIVPLNEHAKMRKHRMARRKARLERESAQRRSRGIEPA